MYFYQELPTTPKDLRHFLNKITNPEILIGRGYFRLKDGKAINNKLPKIDELYWDETPDSDNDNIDCKKAKRYIAKNINNRLIADSKYWIKGIPANPDFAGCREAYWIVCVGTKPKGRNLRISRIVIFARIAHQFNSGWLFFPGQESLESNFTELSWAEPEVIREISLLTARRFIPRSGFSFIGKPMPKNKEIFHPNPKYTLAYNSGWRNVYWHLSIDVDENDIIQNLELSTYQRDVSMFQRPILKIGDLTDAFDAALMIADQYSEEEWNQMSR